MYTPMLPTPEILDNRRQIANLQRKLWCGYQEDTLRLYFIKHHAIPSLNSALGGERLVSRHCFFTHGEKSSRYPLYMRLDGSQSRSGHYREEKNLLSLPGTKPRLLSRPVIVIYFQGFLVPKTAWRSPWRGFTQELEQNSLLQSTLALPS
jgi:hypothetical protein